MTHEREHAHRSHADHLAAGPTTVPTPGKSTLALGAPVLRKAAPIQRQGDGKAPPPPVVYQYGAGTQGGRFNDCGPACVWMILRMLGADYEAQLASWIVAHRPDAATYRARYGYATHAAPVGAQERLDVARRAATGELLVAGHLIDADAPRGVMTISAVRAAIIQVLRLLGAPVDDAAVQASIGQLELAAGTDGAMHNLAPTSVVERRADVLAYLRGHVTGDQVVVALGQPQRRTDHGPEDAGWGWGGTQPTDGGRDVGPAYGGHFVIVYAYDAAADTFTILDPSFAAPRAATSDQVIGFLAALETAAVVNLLAVPLATLRGLIPRAVEPAAAGTPAPLGRGAVKQLRADPGADGPGRGPATAVGGGAPLPRPTLAKMERAFATDFSAVRVHEGDHAARVGALAYAQGDDLHFAPGQYRPGTRAGDALIGHELAHVVQQRRGQVTAHADAGVVDDPGLEAEADREGDRAAAHEVPAAHGAAPAARGFRQGLTIPPGPIPVELLRAATRGAAQALAVAQWCATGLFAVDALRAWWAATPAATRGAALGELAVRVAKLEMMLGWIGAGGLSTTTAGWEDQGTADGNLSGADGTSNQGTFPGLYQGIYAGGAGMPGYDWCGMFVGYLYSQVLHLDDASMGADGLEGWRGAITVKGSGNPKIWPERDHTGSFVGWRGGLPRPGDVAVTSHARLAPGATDDRPGHHVALVEEVTAERVRTIDGNVALLPQDVAGSSAASHLPNAVGGRGYALGSKDGPTEDTAYFYNQSRIVCIVRITDRATNFAASGAEAAATPAPATAELLATADAANAQVQAVLNALSDPTAPFDATGTVYGWVRDRR